MQTDATTVDCHGVRFDDRVTRLCGARRRPGTMADGTSRALRMVPDQDGSRSYASRFSTRRPEICQKSMRLPESKVALFASMVRSLCGLPK